MTDVCLARNGGPCVLAISFGKDCAFCEIGFFFRYCLVTYELPATADPRSVESQCDPPPVSPRPSEQTIRTHPDGGPPPQREAQRFTRGGPRRQTPDDANSHQAPESPQCAAGSRSSPPGAVLRLPEICPGNEVPTLGSQSNNRGPGQILGLSKSTHRTRLEAGPDGLGLPHHAKSKRLRSGPAEHGRALHSP